MTSPETVNSPVSTPGFSPAYDPLKGLTAAEAAARLPRHGPNELRREVTRPAWRMLLAQYLSPVIGLLAVACLVSAALGEYADAIAIGAILLVNGLVGFFQEYRAERAMLALRSLTAPRARVLREGHASVIAAAEVVPGDVLLLEAGDVVAADARLLEASVVGNALRLRTVKL